MAAPTAEIAETPSVVKVEAAEVTAAGTSAEAEPAASNKPVRANAKADFLTVEFINISF
jgi:hypothetical protein